MKHIFEASGLGLYPFKLVDYYQTVSGTSCDYCLTFIKNVFVVKSQDGNTFKVGCDCVAKTGDKGLVDQIKAAKKELSRKAAAEARNLQAAAELQQQREANGGLTNYELHLKKVADAEISFKQALAPIQAELDSWIEVLNSKGDFGSSVAADLIKGKFPFGRGADIVVGILSKQYGRRNSKIYAEKAEYFRERYESIRSFVEEVRQR